MSLNKTESSKAVSTAQKRIAYTVAASAAAGAMASSADAEVIYSGVQDLSVAQFTATDLDIDGDGTGDVLLKNYVFGGNYQGLTVNYFPGKAAGFTTGLNYTSALAEGTLIDAAATASGNFAQSMAYANNPDSQFDNATNAYIGLEFPISGPNHFGWIRVSIDNAAGTFVIHDWGYESTPGVGIEAGATPEPGTLGMLAAGAAGLACMRRRKNAA